MRNRLLIITIILCLASISCNKQVISIFLNDWDEDVYYFSENLIDGHKNLFFQYSKSDFDSAIKNLRDNSNQLSRTEIIFGLTKIISRIGDSHTNIEIPATFSTLPFQVEWLSDGVILTEVATHHQDFLGKKILGINNTPIQTVMDSFRTVIPYENESNFKNQVVRYLKWIDFYPYFNFTDTTTELSINFADNTNFIIQNKETTTALFKPKNVPLFLKKKDQYYWYETLPDDRLIYIQYNACRERTDLTFKSFSNQIIQRLNDNPTIEKVILDLRHNGGGSSTIAQPLIEELQKLVSNNRLKSSNIFVLIGRKTFSSAILNALEIKEKMNPIFIGEPTGGKPNHYGEIQSFQLPNSFLRVWYSTKYFKVTKDENDSLIPDVFVDYTSDHLLNGIDPILEKIKQE